MCGIVGIFDTRERRPVGRGLLGLMNDRLAHRGPDGDGLHMGPGIGLGQRRLAIIDVSGGRQPIYNEDGTIAVVFNGEIYNYQDVAAELRAKGHRFATNSDTEVIVHGWEEWGPACVERLRGMFTIALWDGPKETLFLARDRLGKKPLYTALLDDGRLLFASELKALLIEPSLRRDLDPTAIEDYFAYGYIPDPKSIYRSVRKLPPAHRLVWRRGIPEPKSEAFWDLRFEPTQAMTEGDAIAALDHHLREAVRLRLISEVPLGAFLSGGVDSSAVVATMAELKRDPVDTCSIGFADPAYDETTYAAMVARRYGTRHHVQQVDRDDIDLVDRLAGIYDEPFADSSAIPTYRVCQVARQRVTVALSGDGGDEVFAGYSRYRWHMNEQRVRRLVPGALRAPLFGAMAGLWPDAPWLPRRLRLRATAAALARDPAAAYFHSIATVPEDVRDRMFAPSFRRDLGGYRAIEVLRGHMANAQTDDDLARLQYTDIKTYLPGDILVKVDRASMAHSLEVRVPFLDHVLMEWAATLPANLKLRNGEGKAVLKRAMEPKLPHDLLYRRKMGFAVPLADWFRGPLRERIGSAVTSPHMADTGLFDMAALSGLVDDHVNGTANRSATLWTVLMFESFLRQVHNAGATAATTATLLGAAD